MKEEPIIEPIDKALLKSELTKERFVKKTNKLNNEIYVINAQNAPNIMNEIGRLRELSFRSAGGGTGLSIDVDDYDFGDRSYEQLIVWSPEDDEIVGGYRFIKCKNAFNASNGSFDLSTLHYFNFSDKFVEDYLPYTIELGRSWIQPKYQPSVNPRKGLFALDNVWNGLGALCVLNPEIKYLFGKVTMYPHYNEEARNALLNFMAIFAPDKDKLVVPKSALNISDNEELYKSLFDDKPFKTAYKELLTYVKERNENVPPLINSYMSLSDTMKSFGTALNTEFGDVEETGILITVGDIYDHKKDRHMKL